MPPADPAFRKAGQKPATFAHGKDIPLTILDYAGVQPAPADYMGRRIVPPSGVSMRPFLEGRSEAPRRPDQWVAFELFGNGYVVAGDYKAIRVRPAMYGDGAWHLYDIKRDPGETQPLDTEQPERLAEMVAVYERFAEAKGLVPVADNWSPWHGFLDGESPK